MTLRLKNIDPVVTQQREQRRAARIDSISASHTSSSLDAPYRPSADAKSLESSEREFVNLKTRVTDARYTQYSHGVYLKQWRRTLHNIAAADMASKPWGRIEKDANQHTSRVYPGERWLAEMLPHLRQYARQCNWQLPDWCQYTGELQLRVKLKNRYAILATIPWNAVSGGEQQHHHHHTSASRTLNKSM